MNIAHKIPGTDIIQSLEAHSKNVGDLAFEFTNKFTNGLFGKILGEFHDIGKYSDEFQKYIKDGTGVRGQIDHSTAGGCYLLNQDAGDQRFIDMALPIFGHHTGLQDIDKVRERYGKRIPDYSVEFKKSFRAQVRQEFLDLIRKVEIEDKYLENGFSEMLYIRMLASSLFDADFLDTEKFFLQDSDSHRTGFNSIKKLKEVFDEYIGSFKRNNHLNTLRCDLLDQCIDQGKNPFSFDQNLWTLTIPTGGGKTLSSMAFALNRAVETKKERIIYVIPYTSIIEQNAKVFKNIFGKNNVVEHHMNAEFGADDVRCKLATENWDAPIIVTTNVQFFESLFGNSVSRLRKLHNIANSVIIFDEAQMIPLDYLIPCTKVIDELSRNYNCCSVLCTATPPSLEHFFRHPSREIIEDPESYYEEFKRTAIRNAGEFSLGDLSLKLSEEDQVLCVVSTKKKAADLYSFISAVKNKYYLSTNMCPKHRAEILDTIKKRLSRRQECIVISTSLIEAGVDIDFKTVYKELDGLDSIIQAAGRCNREGARPIGHSCVNVFTLFEENEWRYREQERQVALSIFEDYEDVMSIDAVKTYFRKLYLLRHDANDKKNIVARIVNDTLGRYQFEIIAKDFKLIEEDTISVIVPYNEDAEEKIKEIEEAPFITRDMKREIGPYVVNVRTKNLDKFDSGDLIPICEGDVYILKNKDKYHHDVGLTI